MKKQLIGFILTILFLASPLSAQMVFIEQPKNFKPKIKVAACFIRVKDKFLFLKRLPTKPQGNTWGIPGGKFDPGETALQTVVRETREETGINMPAKEIQYFGKYYIRYPDMDYEFHMFEYQAANYPDVQFSPGEHANYKWMSLEEALKMPLIPAQDECIDLVYGDVVEAATSNTG